MDSTAVAMRTWTPRLTNAGIVAITLAKLPRARIASRWRWSAPPLVAAGTAPPTARHLPAREDRPDWAVTVSTSRFAMLVAADWLRCRLSVFALCSRKLVRHLCKPYWRAGCCNRDILPRNGSSAQRVRPTILASSRSWSMWSNAPARSASKIHSRLAFLPRSVVKIAAIASWQERPGRNP
ncbi:MAG: hypothetical protein QOJ51_5969 [Acidobacteriaceae bacterium]|nr:hypothetical protein [Acidobacteriaceae bacterium]